MVPNTAVAEDETQVNALVWLDAVDVAPMLDATDATANADADVADDGQKYVDIHDADPPKDAVDAICYPDLPAAPSPDCAVVDFGWIWCNDFADHCTGYSYVGRCNGCTLKYFHTCKSWEYCQNGKCVPEPPCTPGAIQCMFTNPDCTWASSYRKCKPDGTWGGDYLCTTGGCDEPACNP